MSKVLITLNYRSTLFNKSNELDLYWIIRGSGMVVLGSQIFVFTLKHYRSKASTIFKVNTNAVISLP